ncbi:coil containing protein [Vibrio phage 1.121.O._10N.286.46.C4]|nr:coil containing protein [Vibrio phage 1.121.O._10N.286.46.C4]
MKKTILAMAIALTMTAPVMAAKTINLNGEQSVIRTGTAGGVEKENGKIHSGSVGIDYKTGQIWIQTGDDNASVFKEDGDRQEVGRFVTENDLQAMVDGITGDTTISYAGDQVNNYGDDVTIMGHVCNQSGSYEGNTCNVNIDSVKGDLVLNGVEVDLDDLKGADGKDGVKGDKGEQGTQGVAGQDGKDGVKGAKGDTGTNGKDGKDGVTTFVNKYDKDQVDADFVSEEELQAVKDRIEEVNVEDQRVVSGELNGDGKLVLTNADMDGGGKNDVVIDVSGLDQSEEVAKVQEQLDNTVDVWTDSEGNGYGATLTDSEGNTVQVAGYDDVAANREAINNTHNQINGEGGIVDQIADLEDTKADKDQVTADINDAKDAAVSESNSYTDSALADAKTEQAGVDSTQNDKIAEVEKESKDRDAALSGEISRVELEYTQRDNELQKSIDSNTSAIESTNDRINTVVADQAITDNKQDTAIQDNKREIEDNTQRINGVHTASVERDEALQNQVDEVKQVNVDQGIAINDNRENIINNTVEIRKTQQQVSVNASGIAANLIAISNNAAHNEKQDNRMSVIEEELYTTTARSVKNEQRIGKLEYQVQDLYQANERQDGMIAGVLAASTFEMPLQWDGSWAMQGAIGHYNGQNALALGAVHAGEGYAVRMAITGSDADDFSKLGYAASVTISTSLFK